jgi:hypothetical protein
MPLSDIATVTVTTTGAGVTRAGYGVPLIVSHTASWAERYRTYTSLSGVNDDFDANEPEYLAAQAIFSQSPSPNSIVIGRAALKPAQAFLVGVESVGTLTPYTIRVAVATGTVFTSQDAEYQTAGATGWRASGLWKRGDLISNDVSVSGQYLYSCLGPSGAGMDAGHTGYGGASGPIGVTSTYRENGVYWALVGTGGTGAVTSDAVVYGLKSAVEYLGSPTAVATGANQLLATISGGALSRKLLLTAVTSGQFFGLQVYNRGTLNIAQNHSDPGIATDLAAIKNAYNSWYGLITPFNSEALVAAAAAWVEANDKLYPAASLDSQICTVAESTASDVAHDLKAQAYARSWAFHHPSNDEFADAAEMGRFFAISPGGETWRMKTLSGVTVEEYSDTEVTNMKDKYAHFYYDIGGRNVVGGDAKTASGEYVDVTRFIDWYSSELQADLADMVIASNKIPYTNVGIEMVKAKVRKRNRLGIEAGGIAEFPEPTISVPDVEDVADADKSSRTLNDVETEWTLAGAIHLINVSVKASV